MLHPEIHTTPSPWRERPLPPALSRVPSRAPWWAPAMAFSALTDLRWHRLLELADHNMLRNNLQVIGQSLASNTPLGLVVERSTLDGQILKAWICLQPEQAQRMTLEVTHRGCLRSLKSLRLPKPHQGLDFWSRFMLVVADRTEQAAFYGPFGTREKAAEFVAEHLDADTDGSSLPWQVVEVVNPFAELLADADDDIAQLLARAWGASQGELMTLMRRGSSAGTTANTGSASGASSESVSAQEVHHRPRSASC
jgi:hypothetical protein